MNSVSRIFAEKKQGFDIQALKLFEDLKSTLDVSGLQGLRIINRYDIEGVSPEEFAATQHIIFSEPTVDNIYLEEIPINNKERILPIEYLPGQYDQRADSAAQCVQILTCGDLPLVKTATLLVLEGSISDEDYQRIKEYCINPIESREAGVIKPTTLHEVMDEPERVQILKNFISLAVPELESLMQELGLAMSLHDLIFCQDYFKNTEKRNPTMTEIRMIDTYWSDHCRHTTFSTILEDVNFAEGPFSELLSGTYEEYLAAQRLLKGIKDVPVTLMNIATIAMKKLKNEGLLDDQEISEENNACSIVVEVSGKHGPEEWLVMFKNETHNHPTEIEPFGGAATCLGGAIRDPLSGRAYVYQAMRVTGSGDPRTSIKDTLPGKLPQKKITTGAAAGYSSYGNQIGLATGQVAEVYHENFVAKRMEVGAVIAAAPRKNVKRETPEAGDIIILVGGRTGRDGCGGATGSSKEHNEESLATCSSEVQKGNPPTERKIQRLFRNPKVSQLIKKCNDFGAGGVSVAIGELADGLEIFLDRVPKKYEGLDGTELAISESQERMAVVVSPQDEDVFIRLAREENLEATTVAYVRSEKRVKMYWRDETIVDISRDFLNTNGASQYAQALVSSPSKDNSYFSALPSELSELINTDIKEAWLANLKDLNHCSKRGLIEMFDSSIGASTVLMPLGGKHQLTPQEGMAAKIPVYEGSTTTGTLMSFGYNPYLASWSPFHGAVFAIIESCAKIAAMGGDYKKIRLTLQEYFEKLGNDPQKWGQPLSALLGAYLVQTKLKLPSIGGKDSMSGTYKDISVPPTLVSFAVNIVDDVRKVVSAELKGIDNHLVLLELPLDDSFLPDFNQLETNYNVLYSLVQQNKILSARSIRSGGIACALSEMALGNMIGVEMNNALQHQALFSPKYGSLLLEISGSENIDNLFQEAPVQLIGKTIINPVVALGNNVIPLSTIRQEWEKPLERIFPTKVSVSKAALPKDGLLCSKNNKGPGASRSKISYAKPRVFIPVFPGTNCEYDTEKAFTTSGAIVDTLIIKNLSSREIKESIEVMAKKISQAQIIALPGGFSAGDEPEGSGKFIATVFRNPQIEEAVMNLLKQRDGLMIGICNGFQALIKLGLVPYGEIRPIDESCPTLTFNLIGRHVSKLLTTRITSKLSPWLSNVELGDTHILPVSHGEGRFMASQEMLAKLFANGQVATQYVDFEGNPTYNMDFNPNGSLDAIEGITSPDGRILGKMAHNERITSNTAVNVPGNKDQMIFAAGVNYFK